MFLLENIDNANNGSITICHHTTVYCFIVIRKKGSQNLESKCIFYNFLHKCIRQRFSHSLIEIPGAKAKGQGTAVICKARAEPVVSHFSCIGDIQAACPSEHAT